MKVEVGGKRLLFDVEGPEYVLDNDQLKTQPTLNQLSPEICQLSVVADPGHGPWRDQPEEVCALIRQFIDGGA